MDYVLYHSNCLDGFGSALSAWKKLKHKANYIPVSHGHGIPDIGTDAKTIYIVDFCFSPSELDVLANLCDKVVILDHHKTALENLTNYSNPKVEVTFDMTKSGALLTWEHFHKEEAPELIKWISDRDLWKFEYKESELAHKALCSYPMDFSIWDNFLKNPKTLISEGEVCTRLYNQLVDNIVKSSWITQLAGHTIPVVNTTIAWSEVGQALLKKYPDAEFAASFTVYGEETMWSLRSKTHFDVSAIARLFDGGGHKNAAGFKIKKPNRNVEII